MPPNKISKQTTINGEKTNGRTKKVGTETPKRILNGYVYLIMLQF